MSYTDEFAVLRQRYNPQHVIAYSIAYARTFAAALLAAADAAERAEKGESVVHKPKNWCGIPACEGHPDASEHKLIRIDRRAWWCSCGADCLNTEGSFDEHRQANRAT